MMKKLSLAMAVLLAGSLTACTGNAGKDVSKEAQTGESTTAKSEEGTSGPVTLTFNWWGGDSRHEATKKAVDAFMAKYPDIKVEVNFGAWTDWETARALEFQSGTAADLSQINMDWISNYDANGDTFLDLNTVSDVIDLTQYDSALLDRSKDSKGGLAGVPIAETGRIFYWDKTTFDEAGIDTPKSLAELRAAGATFKEKLGDDYYPLAMGQYDRAIFMTFYLQAKYKEAIFSDEGKFNFTQDQIKDGIEFIQSLEADHVIPSIKTVDGDGAASFDVNEKFIGGKYAGILEWDSSASKFKKALGDARAAKSQHPKEAAMLLNFLVNDPEGIEIIGTERGIPASKVALEQLTKANKINPMTGEAHKKVLEAAQFSMSPKFDDSSLKGSTGLYTEVFGGVSYGDYSAEDGAKMLFDGFSNVSN